LKIEEIIAEWDKDCKIDETELGHESSKIPQVHNKYLKIYMGERASMFRMRANLKKLKRTLIEYYQGELDQEELEELGREQFYKKILKNEVETYIESDDDFIQANLKLALQEEKVSYVESVIKSVNNRGFQIKSAIDWLRFTTG